MKHSIITIPSLTIVNGNIEEAATSLLAHNSNTVNFLNQTATIKHLGDTALFNCLALSTADARQCTKGYIADTNTGKLVRHDYKIHYLGDGAIMDLKTGKFITQNTHLIPVVKKGSKIIRKEKTECRNLLRPFGFMSKENIKTLLQTDELSQKQIDLLAFLGIKYTNSAASYFHNYIPEWSPQEWANKGALAADKLITANIETYKTHYLEIDITTYPHSIKEHPLEK